MVQILQPKFEIVWRIQKLIGFQTSKELHSGDSKEPSTENLVVVNHELEPWKALKQSYQTTTLMTDLQHAFKE
jgi:hypothetical protein